MGSTAITMVDGERGRLAYRGFDVSELAGTVPYESVMHLLIFGDPPSADPSPEIDRALRHGRGWPAFVRGVLDALPPDQTPLDALRTVWSALSPSVARYPPTLDEAYPLVALGPTVVAAAAHRRRRTSPPPPRDDLGHVANFLYALTGTEPEPRRVEALETYFVLLADHGMNPSTLALRTVVSARGDLASAFVAAISALKGPLHGGAPREVSAFLDRVRGPERAEAVVREALARGERLPGFGHRIYRVEDPRAVLFHDLARRVAHGSERLEIAEAVERAAVSALSAAHPGRRVYTNVDFYGAIVLETAGLEPDLFTPAFALARTAGWTAHVLEQAGSNRLIHPDLRYDGPIDRGRWPRPPIRPSDRSGATRAR